MSHCPCAASYATDGSLARGASPGGFVAVVNDGRTPDRHVRPESVEVAQPIPDAPPSTNRPTWNDATAVVPQPAALGSTSVPCWPGEEPSVSVEISRDTSSQSDATLSPRSAVTLSIPLPHLTWSTPPNSASIRSALAVPEM